MQITIAGTTESCTCSNCKHLNSKNVCYKIGDYIYPDYTVLDDSGFYIEGYDIENPIAFCCNKWQQKA